MAAVAPAAPPRAWLEAERAVSRVAQAKSGAYVLTVEAQVRADGAARGADARSCLVSNEVAIELQGGSAKGSAGGS